MSDKKLGLGLVLEGGGVKGAYELGALIALYERGYSFGAVTGTSIGALNGATLASRGLDALEECWEKTKHCPVFDFDQNTVAAFHRKDFDLDRIIATGKKLIKARTIIRESSERATNFVRKHLDEAEIRAAEMDFGLVAYNLTDMKAVEAMRADIPEGQLIDFIIASACFPIFPPVVIEGKKYIDGGVYDNLPVNLLASAGWKDMVVIRTHPSSREPKRRITAEDLNITYIAPSEDLGRAMAFSPQRIEELKKLGYEDAVRVLDCPPAKAE